MNFLIFLIKKNIKKRILRIIKIKKVIFKNKAYLRVRYIIINSAQNNNNNNKSNEIVLTKY